MRDVLWYGQQGQRLCFGSLVCGFCLTGVPELAREHIEGELQHLTCLDAVQLADTHADTARHLLDCDGGCGRNLIDTCAQLPLYWWPCR